MNGHLGSFTSRLPGSETGHRQWLARLLRVEPAKNKPEFEFVKADIRIKPGIVDSERQLRSGHHGRNDGDNTDRPKRDGEIDELKAELKELTK